jgi:hypothetical protein
MTRVMARSLAFFAHPSKEHLVRNSHPSHYPEARANSPVDQIEVQRRDLCESLALLVVRQHRRLALGTPIGGDVARDEHALERSANDSHFDSDGD